MAKEDREHYVFGGPADQEGLPRFWSNKAWGWVDFKEATRFDFRVLCAPLPLHPPFTRFILDADTTEMVWQAGSPVGGWRSGGKDFDESI